MSYPYCYSGLSLWFCGFFNDLTMKNIKKTGVGMSDCMLSERVLARWWHPLAFSEAPDPLHRPMHAVSYRRIAMAIETARKVGVFSHCYVVDCRPGVRGSDTERVVTRWRCLVAPIWPWTSSIGRCRMDCFNASAWPSKWPAMEVHSFVAAAFFASRNRS
jgi:hypothetical protein